MADQKSTRISTLLGGAAGLALLLALFFCTRGGGWLSFALSCPFLSAALLLFLAAARLSRVVQFGFIGACVVGGLAFWAGFIGPIIFTPESNQGPLLGIFITGPLGTLPGTLLGILVAGLTKRCRRAPPPLGSRTNPAPPAP